MGTYPDEDFDVKNQAILRGAQRLCRIMTGIWRKKQVFGLEMKTQDIHIAYNPVARFNMLDFAILHGATMFV